MSQIHDKNIIDEESLEVSPLCVSKNSSFKSSSELFAFGSIIVSLGFICSDKKYENCSNDTHKN